MNFLSEEKKAKLSEVLFYVALSIELGIMLLDKSELSLHNLSTYVFYVTFAISVAAVFLMKHEKKEWMILGAIFAFSFICWRITRRNDILRYTVFLMAARDVDVKKVMKYIFYVSTAGFLLLAILSAVGVLGCVALPPQDFGRDRIETRYVFGFGHPNDFYSCVFIFVLLWVWNYGETAILLQWITVFVLDVVACILSQSRTGFVISIVTFVAGLLAGYIKKLRDSKTVYMLTMFITPFLCMGFSVWAAAVCSNIENNVMLWLNSHLNDRIINLYYDSEKHAGYIGTWKLFSDMSSDRNFDMGWVKLFYQYGIIPGIIVAAIIVIVISICYKKKDIWTLIIILSLSIYSIVEGIFVSRFIGRLFILPVIGVYLGEFVRGKRIENNV